MAIKIKIVKSKKLDNIYARYANTGLNPELFSTYEPPYEDTVRWSRYKDEKNNIP